VLALAMYGGVGRRSDMADVESQLAKAQALLLNTSLVSALPDGGTNVMRRIAALTQQLQSLNSAGFTQQ